MQILGVNSLRCQSTSRNEQLNLLELKIFRNSNYNMIIMYGTSIHNVSAIFYLYRIIADIQRRNIEVFAFYNI